MSKAFTKETDGDDDDDLPDIAAPLPAGSKNYLTPDGHARLTEELRQLRRVERPRVVEVVSWAAGNGDRSENGDYLHGKKRLREIDRRVQYLMKRLEIAEVVDVNRQKTANRSSLAPRSVMKTAQARNARSASSARTRPARTRAKSAGSPPSPGLCTGRRRAMW